MHKFHLAWDDSSHALGVTSIDSQHRELIGMVNELVEAIAHDCSYELTLGHMANIIHFTEEHFAQEEELMRQHDFPSRDEHAAEHQRVLDNAITMMEALKPDDDINRAILVTAYLTDWVESHILHDDKALALYLREKGLR